jgi:polyisoprenoid-binding protein YceI
MDGSVSSATCRIDRKDFGVNWNRTLDAGGVVVSDDVRISIEVELIRQAQPATSN